MIYSSRFPQDLRLTDADCNLLHNHLLSLNKGYVLVPLSNNNIVFSNEYWSNLIDGGHPPQAPIRNLDNRSPISGGLKNRMYINDVAPKSLSPTLRLLDDINIRK